MAFATGSYVWIPDADEVVIPAKVETSFSPGSAGKVFRLDNERSVKLSADDTKGLTQMHEQCLEGLDDMVSFKQLDENAILHNLRLRFQKDIIYTNIGRILTSVNPFKMLPIYSPGVMDEYMEKGSRKMAPHVFGVADDAFNAMIENKASQSCIVSGESGAGKTEATKVFLQYISEKSKRVGQSKGGSKSDSVRSGHEMQQKILESNPLMEAFGNAKTVRNDNSSRFGKWIEIQFDRNSGGIVGGSIKSYLLEKSRIVNQSNNERNYHVFYQLCAASQVDPELERYNLADATQYHYLNQSEEPCTVVPSIDDLHEWNATTNAMEQVGIDQATKHEMINILNAVLTLGNIGFTGTDVSALDTKDVVTEAANMIGCKFEDLERALIKVDRSNPADPNLVGNHDLAQACDARDAFAKHLYALLFDWIIAQINVALGRVPDDEKISTIGVLDIFGFEFFQNNSFEQLCINFCNEKLQGHFNDHIFKLEQKQYAEEGIDVTKIEFVDNANVIETIDKKGTGLLQIIANELQLKTASDETLLKKLKAKADEGKKDPRNVLTYPDVKEVKKDPELDTIFRVAHYAGTVGYRIDQFLEKNRDSVPKLLQKLGEKSTNTFIQGLFKEAGAAKKQALGLRFSGQLKDLMKDLNATQPHYVRCVKPNAEKERDIFTANMVMDQLRYAGLLEVCKIRQMGYPVRRGHDEFLKRYRHLASKGTSYPSHQELIAQLKEDGMLSEGKYQVGTSKVFLKTDQADLLEEERATSLSLFVTNMQRVARGFIVRAVTKKYKGIRKALRDAIASRKKADLRPAMLGFGELPYGGKHLKEYREAADLMNRIEDEERVTKQLKDAMESRDVSQINAALKSAEQKELLSTPEAIAAKQLVATIEKEEACKLALRNAIEAADEAALKNAVAEAKSLNIGDCQDCSDAEAVLKAIEKERVCRGNLESAIKAKDIAKIKQFMNQMADLGKGDDPLVHQGEDIVKEKAKEDALVHAKKEQAMFALQKAIRERNLQALNDLEHDVIELGLDNEIVAEAKRLRKSLAAEKEICAKLNAESTAANAQAQSRAGLASSDLDALRKLVEEADEVLQPDDFQLLSAKDDLYKLETQLEVQGELEKAMIEFTSLKKTMVNEKDKSKREEVEKKCLSMLKDANNKAEESGINTQVSVDIRDKLAQLQVEIDDRNKKAKQAEIEENKKRLVEASEDDLEQDAAKRLQFTAQSADLSQKHRELIAEAADATRYTLGRFYRIRADDDFVEKVPIEHKEAAARAKLMSQSKPITRSLCRLDEEQNAVAIRINRAILQYCGDLATTFPATLAQYVLIRGLEDPTITDEIYIQIIKHISNNEKPDSADKAWLLMCMCTKIFPPSQEFATYLLNFFITKKTQPGLIGNYARLCIVQLDATIELGPTWFKPNLEEIQSYRKRPPILATIYTLEGKQIDYPVTPDMRVAQVLDLIRRKENVEDDYEHPTWGIYVMAEEEQEESSPKERLIRFYQHYNPAKLAHVDLFLDHWRGNAEELFEKLSSKYGPEPTQDDKSKKKGMLSLPITAAMNAVKFLGFANQRDQPPAPESPFPLPWWCHLGDVYFRMTRQKKVPRFVFKRRLITKQETVDKWLYLQAVDDIRMGYLPVAEPAKVAMFAALALQYDVGPDKISQNLSAPGLLDLGLQKFVPDAALEDKSIQEYASLVLGLLKNGDVATTKDDIMLTYVSMARQLPVYGMNFFYARHAASEKNYVISVDVDGIHVLEEDRSQVKRSFGFHTIKKFGATAEYFWMNIDEKMDQAQTKQSKFKFLTQSQGINVLLYTLQSWEMYDCVYDATHIELDE